MLRCSVEKAQNNSLWSVLLLQSGRFAITIFDRSTPILHKVFRHYTIRAKSGGSQSSHDNKGVQCFFIKPFLLWKFNYILNANSMVSRFSNYVFVGNRSRCLQYAKNRAQIYVEGVNKH
jgi:hypothetical protein